MASARYNMFHIVLVALIAFLCSYAAKLARPLETQLVARPFLQKAPTPPQSQFPIEDPGKHFGEFLFSSKVVWEFILTISRCVNVATRIGNIYRS